MDSGSGVGVLDKAAVVLGALEAGPSTLAQLVTATGLARPTAHRLAVALEAMLTTAEAGRLDVKTLFALEQDLLSLSDAIGLHYFPHGPNASRPEKLWPEDAWIALGREWQARGRRPVILWGSPEEEARARRIAAGCEGSVPPFLSVGQTMPLLAGALEVIGLDTGLTHLAAAFGPPTLGIYCDHDPGLAGVTGPGRVASVGGKGVVPGLDQVQRALADLQHGA